MANGQPDTNSQQALDIYNRLKGEQRADVPDRGNPTQFGSEAQAIKNFFGGLSDMFSGSFERGAFTGGPGTVAGDMRAQQQGIQQMAPEIPEQVSTPDQQLKTADPNNFLQPPQQRVQQSPYSQQGMADQMLPVAALSQRPGGMGSAELGEGFDALQQEMEAISKPVTPLERKLSLDPVEELRQRSLERIQGVLGELDNITEKVQPGKFWSDLPTWQKILAGLSMALGSITPQGAANVQKIWSNAMDRDIEAQKANMNRKDNLLSKYNQILGDIDASAKATKLAQMQMLNSKIEFMKQKATLPAQLKQYELMQEKLGIDTAKLKTELYQSIQEASFMQNLEQGNAGSTIGIPKKFKQYAVDGFGVSKRADTQSTLLEKNISNFRDTVSLTDINNSVLNELREMIEPYAGNIDSLTLKMATDKEFAGKVRASLGLLKLDILKLQKGPGSDRDLEVVNDVVADPTSISRSAEAFMGASERLIQRGAKEVISKAKQLGFREVPTRFKSYAPGFYREQFGER